MSSVKSDSGEDALLSILAARIWTDGSRESHAAQAYPQARQGILITGYKIRIPVKTVFWKQPWSYLSFQLQATMFKVSSDVDGVGK